jgi:Holliday junction resolvase RusA-like endonuclease
MDPLLKSLLDDFEGSIRVLRTGYFVALEKPQAKQSTRFGGKRCFTDTKKVKYLKTLAKIFKQQHPGNPLNGMLRLSVIFSFPWTQSELTTYATLGWSLVGIGTDLDNLLKPVKDALKKIAMNDDAQIVEVRARKIRYHTGLIVARLDEVMPNRLWGKDDSDIPPNELPSGSQ